MLGNSEDLKKGFVIAVDGPAGSGKSTVARRLAQRLGFLYIDTGAMYRAFTLKAVREGVALEDEKALTEIARTVEISLASGEDGTGQVLLDGEDVTELIRTQELTNQVHYIARTAGVREQMVARQRQISLGRRVVAEGRDIGTVVFPKADIKFYLDASFQVRAKRRYDELRQKSYDVNLKAVKEDLKARDARDQGRALAPLKKAEDALYIDTTNLDIEEVITLMISKLPGRVTD